MRCGCAPCPVGDECNDAADCESGLCGEANEAGGIIGPGPAECEALEVVAGQNEEQPPNNADAANDGRIMAIQYTVPQDTDIWIDRIEFFVGGVNALSEVFLFDHDGRTGLPGKILAQADFAVRQEEGWQGGRFAQSIRLRAGTIYWFGQRLVGGRASMAARGLDVPYVAQWPGTDDWDRVFFNIMMVRAVTCDGGAGAGDCPIGEECPQVCLEQSECGNGVQEAGEACDDGNLDVEVCPYGERDCSVCNDRCERVPGETSFCGDGQVDQGAGEGCDDGNDDDADGCNNNCQVQNACAGCECETAACVPGDVPQIVDTLNLNRMTFYPLHIDECVPGQGNCCPGGTTTQSSMDALCRFAGHCQAVDFTIETLRADNCYCWGTCTNCRWFPNAAKVVVRTVTM